MNSQTLVALTIVVALTLLGAGLIVAGFMLKDAGPVWGGVGTVIGALATALNAPNGARSAAPAPLAAPPPAPAPPAPIAPPAAQA